MKRKLYSAILSAAVFAAAADTYAQSNVYSLNVGSVIISNPPPVFDYKLLVGPRTNRFGFELSRDGSDCSLGFAHQLTCPNDIETSTRELVGLTLSPFRFRVRPWFVALTAGPAFVGLSYLFRKRPFRRQTE
jgi:hypothetical protein